MSLAPSTSPFEIVFDGGSLGNPGKGYGSYQITLNGEPVRLERLEFGDNITNNQAEYRTLIAALAWLGTELGSHRAAAHVIVHGDSKLVINQVNGTWKVKHENMRPLVAAAKQEIAGFGSVQLMWHARVNSVKRLGH
jgi:ribonuclease HI